MSDLHWTQQMDQDAAQRRHEERAQYQRQLDEAARAHAAAADAHAANLRAHFRPTWHGIDWDAPSQTEQTYQQQQDRRARWQAYRATAQAAESGWVRHEQPPQWFR